MSAQILPFIRDSVFGPADVARMGEAFDQACAATVALGQPSVHRAIIAKRIIELAKAGERDPQILCEHALEALRSPYAERSSA